ncbi:hypothetical protein Bbelb_007650 [Branchiostoma belcheri]|nr:hypothetical protein Bbelb_007650 [Branchiostoma belcheri]
MLPRHVRREIRPGTSGRLIGCVFKQFISSYLRRTFGRRRLRGVCSSAVTLGRKEVVYAHLPRKPYRRPGDTLGCNTSSQASLHPASSSCHQLCSENPPSEWQGSDRTYSDCLFYRLYTISADSSQDSGSGFSTTDFPRNSSSSNDEESGREERQASYSFGPRQRPQGGSHSCRCKAGMEPHFHFDDYGVYFPPSSHHHYIVVYNKPMNEDLSLWGHPYHIFPRTAKLWNSLPDNRGDSFLKLTDISHTQSSRMRQPSPRRHAPTMRRHAPTMRRHAPTMRRHAPTMRRHAPTMRRHAPTMRRQFKKVKADFQAT